MPRVTKVEHAAKDYPEYDIKKGDTYYWWKFRYSGKRVSKTYPKRSQLTQSSFLADLWDLEDTWAMDREDPCGSIEDLKSQISDLKDRCEESLENMPENLRESSDSGNTLQGRIDQLDEWIGNLDGIDYSVDEGLTDEEKEDRLDEIEQEIQDANPGIG